MLLVQVALCQKNWLNQQRKCASLDYYFKSLKAYWLLFSFIYLYIIHNFYIYTLVCLKWGLACVTNFGENPHFLEKARLTKRKSPDFLKIFLKLNSY